MGYEILLITALALMTVTVNYGEARFLSEIDLHCPRNTHFVDCVKCEQEMCGQRPPITTCDLTCVSGCECDPGWVLAPFKDPKKPDPFQCIRINNCPKTAVHNWYINEK